MLIPSKQSKPDFLDYVFKEDTAFSLRQKLQPNSFRLPSADTSTGEGGPETLRLCAENDAAKSTVTVRYQPNTVESMPAVKAKPPAGNTNTDKSGQNFPQ